MKWYDMFNVWVYFFCAPIDQVFIWMFGFAPDVLKMICASMLILTIGKILDMYERKVYHVIKFALYIWFLFYTLYCLDFITEIKNYDALDWGSILFGIFAPLCLIVVGYFLKSKFKSIFHFDFYYILMTFYLIIGVLWVAYRPEQINFSMYCFFWSVLLLLVYLFSYITKGVLSTVSGDEKASLWHRTKILSKILVFTIVYWVVWDWLVGMNPETNGYPENWLIGIVGLIPSSLFTMMYYNDKRKHIFVFLLFFFLSFLIVDTRDFIIFIGTLTGFILFVISLACCCLLLIVYKKRAEYVGMAILFTIVDCAIFAFFFALNNEKIVENWVLGLLFTILFCVLYLLPAGKFWLLIKKFHLFMIMFWLSWFLIDLTDFITTIITIYM